MKIPTIFTVSSSPNSSTMENNDQSEQDEGPKTTTVESSKKRPRELNAQVLDAESKNDEELPFQKRSYLWMNIESLPVFTMLPQKPHFSPLKDCNEDTREGAAIGHMWTFASLVTKVCRLQIEDPRSVFERYLEALGILEKVGFDVRVVVDRVNKLLAFKTKQEHVESKLKHYRSEIKECGAKREKLIEELNAIIEKMKELKEQRRTAALQKAEEGAQVISLQRSASFAEDDLCCLKEKFKLKAGAPW